MSALLSKISYEAISDHEHIPSHLNISNTSLMMMMMMMMMHP